MKQICTQITALCLLVLAQNSFAQSCSTSSTDPNPTPGWGTPLTVSALTGFSSTNGTILNAFPKNQTTVLTSPAYHYTSDQGTIYFDYNFTKAVAGNTTATPVITILPTVGSPITCSSSAFNFVDGTGDVYFSISPATLFPAVTDFRIQISITLTGSDKALTANTLKTNAILSGANSPLPVKFAGFYAKNTNGFTSLTWNVATESNVTGYEVQRSIDGSKFSKIGFVSATNSPSYSFIDSKAVDLVYYRIKSIDVDGKYGYSIIINVKGIQSDVVMKAFPLPVQNELTVQHNAASDNGKIQIISADGRMIKSLPVAKDAQQTNIDLSSAKSGMYVVRFVNGANIQTAKIIKQ